MSCLIPAAALERIERLTRAEDHLLVFALYRMAAAGQRTVRRFGVELELQPGEVAEAQDHLAHRARLTRQSVRTSLTRLEAAGLVSLGRMADQPGDEPLVNRSVLRVRLLHYVETVLIGADTNRSGGNFTATPAPFSLAPAEPAGAPRRRPSQVAQVIDLFCRCWTEVRGGTYSPTWGRDGAAARRMLARAGLEEIELRARRALADPFFQRAGSVAMLDSRWSVYDGIVRPGPPGPAGGPPRREVVGRDADGAPIYREGA